jgi:LysM repeat protein
LGAAEDAARSAADREAAEEHYRILSSRLEDLSTSQTDLQQKFRALSEGLQRVREEARSRPGQDQFVTREEFNKLVETVREIDRKREADKREILGEIEALGERLTKSMREGARRSTPPASEPIRVEPRSEPPPANQEGVWYVVEKGNTLSKIIEAHNAEFKGQGRKTTLKLVREANPKLVPESIQVGQKIFIPMVLLEGN